MKTFILILFLVVCIGCTKKEPIGGSSEMPREISEEQIQENRQHSDALPPRVDPTDPNVIKPADPHP